MTSMKIVGEVKFVPLDAMVEVVQGVVRFSFSDGPRKARKQIARQVVVMRGEVDRSHGWSQFRQFLKAHAHTSRQIVIH